MSSAVVSTSAATSRLFVFDEEVDPEMCLLSSGHRKPAEMQEPSIIRFFQSTISNQQSAIGTIINRRPKLGNSVILASRLEIRSAPEKVASGIPALDALTGGLARGCLTEICGPASSGRTTVLLAALAAATHRGEFCALVDSSDALDPQSVAAAGVKLDRLLWVSCGEEPSQKSRSPQSHRSTEKTNSKDRTPSRNANHSEHRLEQVLRATDLLLESGGFGLIALDLGDLPPQAARRIPLTTWFRFRRTVEHTPTILLAIEQQPIAGSCSSLRLQLGPASELAVDANEKALEGQKKICRSDSQFAEPSHTRLLMGLDITAELIRSRVERKPVCSTAVFASKTAWAG